MSPCSTSGSSEGEHHHDRERRRDDRDDAGGVARRIATAARAVDVHEILESLDDERALAFYDALRTFVDFEGFSELKRSDRRPLDLPLLTAS